MRKASIKALVFQWRETLCISSDRLGAKGSLEILQVFVCKWGVGKGEGSISPVTVTMMKLLLVCEVLDLQLDGRDLTGSSLFSFSRSAGA